MDPTKIPNITGYPVIDTLIKLGILAVAAFITGWSITWMEAHGYNSATVSAYMPYLVISLIVVVLTVIWAALSKYKTIVGFVEQVLEAAQSGKVPEQTQKLAPLSHMNKIATINYESTKKKPPY